MNDKATKKAMVAGVATEKPGKGSEVCTEARPARKRIVITALPDPAMQITQADIDAGIFAGSHPDSSGVRHAAGTGSAGGDCEVEVVRFIALVNQGIESWVGAGKLLAKLRLIQSDIFTQINQRAPWISIATLVMFERIGRGVIYPRVLLLPPLTAARVSKLSYTEQEKACNQPIAEIKRQFPPTLPAKHNSIQHHARTHSPEREVSLADKLPCVGFFKLTVMNGKAFVQKCERDASAIPVTLDGNSSVVVQVLKRKEYVEIDEEKPAPLPITEELTEKEKEWRKFRNEL